MRKVVTSKGGAVQQRGITRMGRPPAGASRAAWAAATMQLMGIIKMRGGGKSNAELEALLGLGKIDEDGAHQHGGRYFARYLAGTSALHPNDLQQVAELAQKKGLLRPADTPRMLGTAIESLVGQPHTLLADTLATIQAERVSLTQARQSALDALDELARMSARCKSATLAHTVGVNGDYVCEEGVGIDLAGVRAAIDDAYVAVFAPRPITDLLPTIAGTNPAQSKSRKLAKAGDNSPQKSIRNKDIRVD